MLIFRQRSFFFLFSQRKFGEKLYIYLNIIYIYIKKNYWFLMVFHMNYFRNFCVFVIMQFFFFLLFKKKIFFLLYTVNGIFFDLKRLFLLTTFFILKNKVWRKIFLNWGFIFLKCITKRKLTSFLSKKNFVVLWIFCYFFSVDK